MTHQKSIKIHLFQFFVLFFTVTSYSSLLCADEQSQPFATHTLFIFIDKIEVKFGAVSMSLFEAFDQKAGPILASSHLVRILNRMPSFDDLISDIRISEDNRQKYISLKEYYESLDNWLERNISAQTNLATRSKIYGDFNRFAHFLADSQYDLKATSYGFFYERNTTQAALLKKISSFNSEEWIIREVNEDLLLFIPKEYIGEMQKKINFVAPKHDRFTEIEFSLGMQIDHMNQVDSLTEYFQLNKNPEDLKIFDTDLREAFDRLFIPKAEYAQESSLTPTWTFFVVGHGLLRQRIVGMSLEQFKDVLDFFEVKLVTKLLVYSSCYAAGTNAEIIYKNPQNNDYKTYSFAIVTGALTDAPTSRRTLQVHLVPGAEANIDFEKKRIKIVPYHRLNAFVEQVAVFNGSDYLKVIATIFPSLGGLVSVEIEGWSSINNICNLPQIKLPGARYFDVMDTAKRVVAIDDTWALSGKKEIDIASFLGARPSGVLLYTNYVPCVLKINMNFMPIIIPMALIINFFPRNIMPYVVNPIFEIEGAVVDVPFDEFLRGFNLIRHTGFIIFKINSLIIKNREGIIEHFDEVIIESVTDKELYAYKVLNKNQESMQYQQYDFVTQTWNAISNEAGDFLYRRIEDDPILKEAREKAKQAAETGTH